MEEQHHTDDQSHYEISLTAGQAFVAFVLLLLSLAASFAFGLMIGKGQADERLIVRKETPVVTEASLMPPKKGEGRIVDLPPDDEEETETAPVTETTDALSGAPAPSPAPAAESGASPNATIVEEAPAATQTTAVVDAIPHYAQLLSTGDQKIAESLAAKLIEKGFTSAYVERGSTEKGPVFRVRVKFGSEPDARAAEGKLKEFSKDVWITAK